MHRSMDHVRIKADVFHDVDLTTVGPRSVCPVGGKHPNRGPGTTPGRQLRTHLDATVSPITFAFGDKPRGCVLTALPSFFSCFDNPMAVLDACVLHASVGVVEFHVDSLPPFPNECRKS